MTGTELAELDRELAEGPRLVSDAVFGACIGAVVGWLGYAGGRNMGSSVLQGAGAGAAVALASYGFKQWKSSREHSLLRDAEHRAGFLAPHPLHRASITYPWSAH
jgi:hypothetical protein